MPAAAIHPLEQRLARIEVHAAITALSHTYTNAR